MPADILVRGSLSGDKALKAKLDQLEKKVVRQVTTKALRAGAQLVLDRTKEAAPVRTGTLRKALALRAGKRRRGSVAVHVAFRKRDVPKLVKFSKSGKRFFYPSASEYGTRHQSARPYMHPAFESTKDAALTKVTTIIRDGVLDAAKAS